MPLSTYRFKRKTSIYRLKKNVLNRWIVLHAISEYLAWSGERWSLIGRDGLAVGDVRIPAFENSVQADQYGKSQPIRY